MLGTSQVEVAVEVANAVGWWEILRRTSRALYEDDCLGWAAGLAYCWFLALFPALLFIVALTSYLPVQNLIEAILTALASVAPGDVLILVREQLAQITARPPAGLLTVSLVGTVWSSSSGMMAIVGTLNQAYHVKERRAWWRVRVLSVGLTAALAVFALTAVAFVMVGPIVADELAARLHLSPVLVARLWAIVEWPLFFG